MGSSPKQLTKLIEALQDDPAIGRVLVLYDAAVDAEDWSAVLQAVKVARADVTVASTLPELVSDGAIAGLRSGIRAMRPLRTPRTLAARTGAGRMLGEPETKALLRAADISVPDGEVTDDAVATWRELGGPVAVKRLGVTHKAREGGVVLDLTTTPRASARGRAARARPRPRAASRRRPASARTPRPARRAARPGRTAGPRRAHGPARHRGPRRHPPRRLVPVLVVGAGGVHTEQLDDVAVIPLPADAARIAEAIRTLRTPIPPEPIARLAEQLQTLPLALIELNPVIVHGDQAVAVDALAQEAS